MSRLSLLKPVFALAVLTGCGIDQPVTESTSFEDTNQSAIVLTDPAPEGVVGEVILENQVVAPQPSPDDRFDVTLSGASNPAEVAPAELAVAPAPSSDNLFDVTLSGASSAAEGTPVELAIGFPGCGWWIAGTAQGVVASGQLSITVEDVLPAMETGGAAFVFIDHDRDGTCDVEKGDAVFQTPAPASGGHVSLAASALLPAESWYCMFFNGYGA